MISIHNVRKYFNTTDTLICIYFCRELSSAIRNIEDSHIQLLTTLLSTYNYNVRGCLIKLYRQVLQSIYIHRDVLQQMCNQCTCVNGLRNKESCIVISAIPLKSRLKRKEMVIAAYAIDEWLVRTQTKERKLKTFR